MQSVLELFSVCALSQDAYCFWISCIVELNLYEGIEQTKQRPLQKKKLFMQILMEKEI